MILMGDEAQRTQHGNNNAYCHDDATNWFDWSLLSKHADIHRFVKLLLARRLLRDVTHEYQRASLAELIGKMHKAWHGVKLHQPDWADTSHSIALTGALPEENLMFHLILNAYWEPLEFELPLIDRGEWRRWIDTSLPSPQDIVEWQAAPPVPSISYRASPRSVVMLYSAR